MGIFATYWIFVYHLLAFVRLYLFSLTHLSLPGQNGRYFADDVFRCIFVNKKFCILIKISLKFVLKGPIDNNPASV